MLIVGLIQLGCATTALDNPFKIAQNEFYAKTKTIALAPIAIPGDLENPEPVKARFESLIEAKLHEAGFALVQSQEMAAIWKQMAEQVGGYFDPLTGQRDESKFNVVREYSRRELSAKFNADAILLPSIRVVRANWSGGMANWDDTMEAIKSTGEQFKEALPLILIGIGVTSSGTVGALSLVVRVEDIHGVPVYSKGGGIQVLAKISGGKFVSVPREELFANEERNVAATNIALGPLVTNAIAKGTSKQPL
jgi:hypothetical protein